MCYFLDIYNKTSKKQQKKHKNIWLIKIYLTSLYNGY